MTSHSILTHWLAKLNSQLDARCSLMFPPSMMDVHWPSQCGPGHITIHNERKEPHVVTSTSGWGPSDCIESWVCGTGRASWLWTCHTDRLVPGPNKAFCYLLCSSWVPFTRYNRDIFSAALAVKWLKPHDTKTEPQQRIQLNCHNVKPFRDRSVDPESLARICWQKQNKDLADGKSGLWLSSPITAWQWSNPTAQASDKGRTVYSPGIANIREHVQQFWEMIMTDSLVNTSSCRVKVQKRVGTDYRGSNQTERWSMDTTKGRLWREEVPTEPHTETPDHG